MPFAAEMQMNQQEFRALQKPLKELYTADPNAAVTTLQATGVVQFDSLTCHLQPTRTPTEQKEQTVAGLHPMAGGSDGTVCSVEILLQALASCAGVTLAAVSCAMGLKIESAVVTASGTMDFRGTLAVNREVPTGLTKVDLRFAIQSELPWQQVEKLIELTERYCVVLQTLKNSVPVHSYAASSAAGVNTFDQNQKTIADH